MNLSVRKYSRGCGGMLPENKSLACFGMFSTTVSVHYFTKMSLDLHDVLAFNTNFSNQGVRMKIKQSDIKNSKMHALVYINLCFHFSSGCLYPLKNCLKCSYTR